MRRYIVILLLWLLGFSSQLAHAATYKLANGQEVTGEPLLTSANDQGIQIKIAEGQYQRVNWGDFSQEDLKQFAQNPKLQPLVEPFVEITQEDKIKRTEPPKIVEPPRLERPAAHSLFGAMFSSGLGWFLMLVLYAATIYAGREVAYFRAQPPLLVMGLSAIPFLGILAPIAFLAMPTRLKPGEETEVLETAAASEAVAEGAAQGAPVEADPLNPMQGTVAHPESLHLAHEEKKASASLPKATVFQRGQFTFNRRFFETRFPNFFGVVRRESDKDMVLVIKSVRGQYTGQRISRIAANDLHIQVHHGTATEEIMVPFVEIQEVRLQHKDLK